MMEMLIGNIRLSLIHSIHLMLIKHKRAKSFNSASVFLVLRPEHKGPLRAKPEILHDLLTTTKL